MKLNIQYICEYSAAMSRNEGKSMNVEFRRALAAFAAAARLTHAPPRLRQCLFGLYLDGLTGRKPNADQCARRTLKSQARRSSRGKERS